MDHSRAPVLEALQAFRDRDYTPFNPPGHRQGRGVDPRVLEVVGEAVFASDVISINGLDDRRVSQCVLADAQRLMADAVHADHTFFATCGSSLSVKSAMLAVAGPHEKLLVARQSHKSVISGLILSGVSPVWVRHLRGHRRDRRCVPRAGQATDRGRGVGRTPAVPPGPAAVGADADLCVTSVHKSGSAIEQSSVFHLRGDRVDPQVLKAREDLLGTTSPTSLVYATLDGWRRQMVEHGKELLGAALSLAHTTRDALAGLPGTRVMGEEFAGHSYTHDPLKIVIDVSGLGISGYQGADWLREHQRVTVGLSDHRRMVAQLTIADNAETAATLVRSIAALGDADLPEPRPVDLPSPADLELETAMLPRDAFFADTEQVDAAAAPGRISAEMITPYPPGAPAVLPGEVITAEVLDYLRSGLGAGMQIPDPVDADLTSIRVVTR